MHFLCRIVVTAAGIVRWVSGQYPRPTMLTVVYGCCRDRQVKIVYYFQLNILKAQKKLWRVRKGRKLVAMDVFFPSFWYAIYVHTANGD